MICSYNIAIWAPPILNRRLYKLPFHDLQLKQNDHPTCLSSEEPCRPSPSQLARHRSKPTCQRVWFAAWPRGARPVTSKSMAWGGSYLSRVTYTRYKREICYFATLNFGCLLLCHPVSMTSGTICVYDLWARWHTSEAHK